MVEIVGQSINEDILCRNFLISIIETKGDF